MESPFFSPRPFRPLGWPLGWAVAASALAHVLILAAILLRVEVEIPAEPAAAPSVELRLIETQGAGPATEVPPPEPTAQPSPPPAETAPTPTPPPSAEAAEPLPERLPLPPPPLPEPPAQAAPPQPRPAAPAPPLEQNLGGGDGLTNALASGPAVVPARTDARFRNREPVYPPSAARRGERGTVMLSIHVGPDGEVAGIDVAESSGFILLDRAAREAVETWHFLPAVRDGRTLASDMKLRVVFQLN